jgi:hypothetical protein
MTQDGVVENGLNEKEGPRILLMQFRCRCYSMLHKNIPEMYHQWGHG